MRKKTLLIQVIKLHNIIIILMLYVGHSLSVFYSSWKDDINTSRVACPLSEFLDVQSLPPALQSSPSSAPFFIKSVTVLLTDVVKQLQLEHPLH